MTDRIHGLTVVLEKHIRADDIGSTMQAICHIRNVASVVPLVSDPNVYCAESRIRSEIRETVIKALDKGLF